MSEKTETPYNEKEVRDDGRCKHGMLPGQCSYCQGIKMPKYGQSVGAAWISR